MPAVVYGDQGRVIMVNAQLEYFWFGTFEQLITPFAITQYMNTGQLSQCLYTQMRLVYNCRNFVEFRTARF